MGRILSVLLLCGLASAAWRSVRLARADWAFRSQSPEGVERAIELAPSNTEYLSLQALQMEYEGEDPEPLLEHIATLNPLASAPRLRLGLAAETRGDFDRAERYLLEAFQVDRQFETRWTLANFYFRQGNEEAFWIWIRSALEISSGDRRPSFALCWRISEDPAVILERAIPDRAEVAADYLWWLLSEGRIEAVSGAASNLVSLVAPAGELSEYREPLWAAADALLAAGRIEEAVGVWTGSGYARPEGVFRPNFEPPRIGHGFDWRLQTAEGVTHVPLDAPAGHRVRLSGDQPEEVELLRQLILGLEPGARYRLSWQAATRDLPSPTGIEWRVADASVPVEAGEGNAGGEAIFQAASALETLRLHYARPLGQVRQAGSVDLREVRIRRVE